MRTTIRLPDDLLRQVKRLREVVSRHRSAERAEPVRLTTVGGGTAFPGVNLDDTASLLDRMQGLGRSTPTGRHPLE